MEFIVGITGESKEDVLDTREKVVQLRQSLIEATAESFEKLANAKKASWQDLHEIVLD